MVVYASIVGVLVIMSGMNPEQDKYCPKCECSVGEKCTCG